MISINQFLILLQNLSSRITRILPLKDLKVKDSNQIRATTHGPTDKSSQWKISITISRPNKTKIVIKWKLISMP